MALSVRSLFRRRAGKKAKQPKRPEGPAAPVTELFAQESRPSSGRAATSLPRFKSTAADQVDRSRSDRFTNVRMKLRAAFTPSQPVIDRRMFAGRGEVLRSMISAIEDQRLHLVIYGERGIGKTSLLHMLADAARDARYIVVYSSCGAGSTFQETFRAAAAAIPLLFHTGFGPTTAEAESGSSLEDLLPERFSPRQLADLCVKLTGTRALFILDEFDRAASAEFRRDLAELIKFLSDRSVRVQLVIAGVAGDLAELVEHIPSIRRNILAVRVPRMTDEEVRELVTSGEQASGLTFDAEAREFVVTLSRGWPYIASLLCHHAGLHAIDAGRTTVLSNHVSGAVDDSVMELRARMSKAVQVQIDRIHTEGGGKLLTVIAGASLAAGGEFDAADIERAAQKTADAAAARRLAEQLAAERMLIEKREDAVGARFVFLEEGLSSYLWFVGAQQQYQDAERKAQRASNG